MSHYSQNDEQEVILEYFRDCRDGKFLDIGAYDGKTFSNTRALLERGWSGVMVEPSPKNFCALMDSVSEFHDRTILVLAAVAPYQDLMNLRLDESEGRKWAASIAPSNTAVRQASNIKIMVPSVTPKRLLEFGPFDFISIDAELMDLEILLSLPTVLPECKIICVEPCDMFQRDIMRSILENAFHFKVRHETPENIIAVRA